MKLKNYFYYPNRDKTQFPSNFIYIGVECISTGTAHLILKFESERFQLNFYKHTKSSAKFITKKKISVTNYKKEYKAKIEVLEWNKDKQNKLLEDVEIIKSQRKQEMLKSNSNSDFKIPSKIINEYDRREHQKFFNEQRMEAVERANKRRK